VGYLLLDRNLNVRAYNMRFKNGLAEKTKLKLAINEHFLRVVQTADVKIVSKYLDRVINNSETVEYEAALGEGADKCYYHIVAVPVTNNEHAIGVCVSATEITARKKMELERQDLIDELLLKNRDLEQFAQILSHNVRGPLATILGLNSFISENMSQEDFLFMMQGIRTSSERLDTVIRDLNEILSLRRELTEAKEPIDIGLITAEVWRSIDQMVQESGALLHADFHKVQQLVTVRSYMRHILYQLLSNSIRFRKPGTIPEIKIWTEKTEDKIIICVADNGMGIDMARYGNKLFQLYQRFHLSVPGKGLGLYLTKTMVEILHGKIVAESKPDAGMSFCITLPA
jgi:signal transduction histidine kinase